MKYITGIHALNLPCRLDGTSGDWHGADLKWDNIDICESTDFDLKVFSLK